MTIALMKRTRLTADQLFRENYLGQTHHWIPTQNHTYQTLRVSICVAVTPFPSGLPDPPFLPYNFALAPSCSHCGAKATNRFVHCPDNKGWLCPI
jgi:hypothetical protein